MNNGSTSHHDSPRISDTRPVRSVSIGTAMVVLAFFALFSGTVRAGDKHNRQCLMVPPAQEIEILDPRVNPQVNPRAIGIPGPNGLEVEVPQVAIVHHFYYTGDRRFQGPLLRGGPTIVVAVHPQTGERCYVEVQMLPGAPCICYRCDEIEYDFGRQAIIVQFKRKGATQVVVKKSAPSHPPKQAKPAGPVKNAFCAAGNAVGSAAGGVVQAGAYLTRPLVNAAHALPLGCPPGERAQNRRGAAAERTAQANDQLGATVNTVR